MPFCPQQSNSPSLGLMTGYNIQNLTKSAKTKATTKPFAHCGDLLKPCAQVPPVPRKGSTMHIPGGLAVPSSLRMTHGVSIQHSYHQTSKLAYDTVPGEHEVEGLKK